MWGLILFIGAFVVAATRKSSRDAAPRQLPPPPGPIAVLGEILRIGQAPSPAVILYAIAEAEALGRHDLASDITRAFGAPAIYLPQKGSSPAATLYPRGSSPPSDYQRGSCALPRSPRAAAPSLLMEVPARIVTPPQPSRPPTEEEYLAMLHADPQAFFAMASSGRSPVIDMPVAIPGPAFSPQPAQSSPSSPSTFSPLPTSAAFVEQLFEVPGFAGAAADLVNPLTGEEIFEVRWLRGYPIPPLPSMIEGRSVRLAITESLATPQPAGMMDEAPSQADASSPGSPLAGVSDNAWREFVKRLAREAPTFSSERSVGQYRQRRERLAELGANPSALQGSAVAQREALDMDLADAHNHAAAGGLLAEHLGRVISVPGHEGEERITLSGILGVIQCAGLEGAVGWLEQPNDRKRFPHTTQVFLRTNGIF